MINDQYNNIIIKIIVKDAIHHLPSMKTFELKTEMQFIFMTEIYLG